MSSPLRVFQVASGNVGTEMALDRGGRNGGRDREDRLLRLEKVPDLAE